MAVYERGVAGHVAERVRPEPDSEAAARLQALADDPASDWRRVDAPEPVEESGPSRPAKSASKADWKVYAIGQGMSESDADAATRDQLAEKYHGGGE